MNYRTAPPSRPTLADAPPHRGLAPLRRLRIALRRSLLVRLAATLAQLAVVLIPGFLILASSTISGCNASAGQIQAQTANAVAVTANATLPLLLDAYEKDAKDAVMAVHDRGGTKQEALDAFAMVDKKWQPVWKAWGSLRVAQDAWATALESGINTSTALAQLRAAYCQLEAVWPKQIKAIPLSVISCGRSS